MNHVETVREIYQSFGAMDVPAILERVGEDATWDAVYGEHEVPWLRARRGRSGVRSFFESLAALEIERFDVTQLLADGDTVVALIDLDAKVRATGKPIRERGEVHVWRFDERGRVRDFRHVVDTLQHRRALDA